MAIIDENKLISKTLSCLGADKAERAFALSEEIKTCLEELKVQTEFRFSHKEFPLVKGPDYFEIFLGENQDNLVLPSKDLNTYFEGCTEVSVVLSSLGMKSERFLKKQQKLSMSHGVVLDTCAGVYLEMMTDATEEELNLGARTFRFCPGYGDLALELNLVLLDLIDRNRKMGVTMTESGLFLPQKSMLGLIGLGKDNLKKSCGSCAKKETCCLRKEGNRCWN